MRRLLVPGLAAIALLFAGSLVLLARLDDGDPDAASRVDPEPAPPPVATPPPPRAVEPAPSPAEVRAQLASPPTDPLPVPPAGPLPPADAAPAFARDLLPALEARIAARCGRVSLRLGDQLRAAGRDAGGHAVLLLDVEPLQDQAKVWGSTVQSIGATRQSVVACAQLHLRGHAVPVSYLRPGGRVKVQVVLGPAAP